MSKAILVIDIPDDLFEDYENFYVDYDLRAERKDDDVNESIRYVEECPLKPMPEKKGNDVYYTVRLGYNRCIDEILGEEND